MIRSARWRKLHARAVHRSISWFKSRPGLQQFASLAATTSGSIIPPNAFSLQRPVPPDVPRDRPIHGSLGVPADVAAPPECRIDRIEIERRQAPPDALHFRSRKRNVVGIGPHE